MTFPAESHFAQHEKAVAQASEEVRIRTYRTAADWEKPTAQSQRETPSPEEHIRSWAATISDCIDGLGQDQRRSNVTTYAQAIARLDDIVREMDEYGTTG